MGWQIIFEDAGVCGYKSLVSGDIWLVESESLLISDFDSRGVNHIAIGVAEQKDVDAVAAFLVQEKIALLFDTPKHRSEFATDESQTYYQVMFKTDDNILFEVVYVGSK